MENSCEDIEQMLIDYADGQLSPADSNKVVEHLAKCANCRRLHNALQKSLKLTGVIWTDSLEQIENVHIPANRIKKFRWPRYAAIAASILLVATASIVWHIRTKPKVNELTFAEIERKINESGSAAQLLAAMELLSGQPDAQTLIQQQYRYIVERYPQTSSAIKAKSKMQ